MQRADVLMSAGMLVDGERDLEYGHPRESLTRIGKMWGAVLCQDDIAPETVALMLATMKAARLAFQPSHTDSWIDLAGYAALGGELAH